MSNKTSCPEACGPRRNTIPTPDENPVDLSPKAHYSCYKSADTSSDKPEEEVENTASSKSEKEAEDTSCDKSKEESENAAGDKPEEEVEETKATVQEDENGKQKRKEIEHSSLFNIADAKSGDVDRVKIPFPNTLDDAVAQGTPITDVEKLVQGTKNRSKSPREFLSVPLPPAESQ